MTPKIAETLIRITHTAILAYEASMLSACAQAPNRWNPNANYPYGRFEREIKGFSLANR